MSSVDFVRPTARFPLRERILVAVEGFGPRVLSWRNPPEDLPPIQYHSWQTTDPERRRLIRGTVARATALIGTSGEEWSHTVDDGLRLVIAVHRRRARRFLGGVRAYISDFRGPESGNETLLALNLLWAAAHCAGYHAALRGNYAPDWSALQAEASRLQVVFARSLRDSADWLEYLHRSGR